MYDMLLKNAEILNRDFQWEHSDLAVQDGRIAAIGTDLGEAAETLDLSGRRIVPGFVDIHIHGCAGSDACDATPDALAAMAGYLITKGVTSFCPTTMTISRNGILAALKNAQACMENPPAGAAIRGVNMEGPYIAESRKGAQKAEFVRRPDWREFMELNDACGGIVRLVALAPECDGAEEFIRHVKGICTISLAHTDADYETASRSFALGVSHATHLFNAHAFELGARHLTHLFNAMTGMSHRAPGAVGAVLSHPDVRAEIICDGFHIHPAVLKIAFQVLGDDRAVIISDSIRSAGLPDGVSELGGQTVYVQDGQARLADGTIAGSTTNLHQELKNLVSWGVPFEQAVKSVSYLPARSVHADDQVGSIAAGKLADIVLLDSELNIVKVMQDGKLC